jgi:hypothetical protein
MRSAGGLLIELLLAVLSGEPLAAEIRRMISE